MAGSSDEGTADIPESKPLNQVQNQAEDEVRPSSPSQTSIIISEPQYYDTPVDTNCPKCGKQVKTDTTAANGKLTWISFSILCLLGCWLGCSLIPFCLRSAKDIIHTCPECKEEIGRLRRI